MGRGLQGLIYMIYYHFYILLRFKENIKYEGHIATQETQFEDTIFAKIQLSIYITGSKRLTFS